MKVITGYARGRNLATLPGADVTRPTTQSTKEALFSSIQFEIEGKRVLDLFAGCGQLGIEALSRGASHCTFVESNRQAYNTVESNIKLCKMEHSVMRFPSFQEKINLILLFSIRRIIKVLFWIAFQNSSAICRMTA